MARFIGFSFLFFRERKSVVAENAKLSNQPSKAEKADVVEHLQVFDHVGLLANKPPGQAGLLFI
jgi:hypothetical protein